jgi:MFS family permease
VYMAELLDDPVPNTFAVNSASLFLSVCILYPIAGILSDWYGRRLIMSIGGIGIGLLSPVLLLLIGRAGKLQNPFLAFCAQWTIGLFLSFFTEPQARSMSVAIGTILPTWLRVVSSHSWQFFCPSCRPGITWLGHIGIGS